MSEEVIKKKKSIFKRWWFWLLVVIIIGTIANMGDDSGDTNSTSTSTNTKKEVKKDPIVVTADDMMGALEENALKAEKTYDNQYVEVTGKVSTIDSDGNYFGITYNSGEFAIVDIKCDIDKKHLDQVMEFKEGQKVTVVGTVTDVGEILGYTIDVESIK